MNYQPGKQCIYNVSKPAIINQPLNINNMETTKTEDPIITLQNLLKDPQLRGKGKQFISDVEYAIFLIERHRKEETDILQRAQSSNKI